MHIQFRLTPEECQQFARVHARIRRDDLCRHNFFMRCYHSIHDRFYALSLLGCVLTGIWFGFLFDYAPPPPGSYFHVPPVIFPWLALVALFFLPTGDSRSRTKAMRSLSQYVGYQTMDITPDLVIVTLGPVRSECQWLAFTRFEEFPDLFILYLHFTSATAQVIPKRAFASEAESDAFRDLAQQKIQPATGGFPVVPMAQPDAVITRK